ncbi:MAG TPA: PilN domain-containing protein [Burkholderiales bacterium]|jgi:type IV pilus assembly protein PilN|nr:PilN domain-containing protein [Burkholderiales bacterium]
MIRINLLPHREMRRAARQRQFAIMAGFTGAIGLTIALLVHFINVNRIDDQQNRNQFLTTEIKKLDIQIDEIKKLKEQTQDLLSRKQVVESLQTNRNEAVYLLDQLLRQLPDGTYLKSVKQTGDKVNLTGYAQSNARVSTLMRNLASSPWLESPELVEIKAATINNVRANEFSLNVKIKRQKPEEQSGPKPKDNPKPKDKQV